MFSSLFHVFMSGFVPIRALCRYASAIEKNPGDYDALYNWALVLQVLDWLLYDLCFSSFSQHLCSAVKCMTLRFTIECINIRVISLTWALLSLRIIFRKVQTMLILTLSHLLKMHCLRRLAKSMRKLPVFVPPFMMYVWIIEFSFGY